MYCVIEVNLTRKIARIACTGLYGREAEIIAKSRNSSYCIHAKNPTYELPAYKNRPDKVYYIISHKNLVENAVRRFWEEYCE